MPCAMGSTHAHPCMLETDCIALLVIGTGHAIHAWQPNGEESCYQNQSEIVDVAQLAAISWTFPLAQV